MQGSLLHLQDEAYYRNQPKADVGHAGGTEMLGGRCDAGNCEYSDKRPHVLTKKQVCPPQALLCNKSGWSSESKMIV